MTLGLGEGGVVCGCPSQAHAWLPRYSAPELKERKVNGR